MPILKGFNVIKNEYVNYFKTYTFNSPIVLSVEKNEELKKLGAILYKAIKHMLDNYQKYLSLMPHEEKDLRILEVYDRYPYRVGTFRTDFVVDKLNHIKIIEMTTRQPLNGYFSSGFFREIALEQAHRLKINGIVDIYLGFFDYLDGYIDGVSHVCVIKGNEKLEEIKIYPSIFENAGIPCHVIPIEELPQKLRLLENAWVIEELTFTEIRGFPLEIVDALARCRLHNSIKAILFTHDKRFYYVLNQPEFLLNALEPLEREILKKYILPTYIYSNDPEEWERAYKNKDEYILKHQIKGKCMDVYAGCITDDASWKKLFDPEILKRMVLQPFVDQRRFDGFVGTEKRNDFVAGTLLYFNQEFFGPGLYRTSSLPVSGLRDIRKIAQLVAKVDDIVPGIHYL
jgi:hypothetical protein